MRSDSSGRAEKPVPPGYEPPRVTVVGTVTELTQAFGGSGFTDAAVFSAGIPSDRRLKDHVRSVDRRAVLTTLTRL